MSARLPADACTNAVFEAAVVDPDDLLAGLELRALSPTPTPTSTLDVQPEPGTSWYAAAVARGLLAPNRDGAELTDGLWLAPSPALSHPRRP